jgi:hypothetical protein
MQGEQTNDEAVALGALTWVLSDDARAERFLALTGLTPADLRARLDEREMLAAVLRFIEAHEPDLLAASDMLGLAPNEIPEARRRLES